MFLRPNLHMLVKNTPKANFLDSGGKRPRYPLLLGTPMHKYFIKDYLPLLVSILNFYQREFEPWKSVSNLGEFHLYAAHE